MTIPLRHRSRTLPKAWRDAAWVLAGQAATAVAGLVAIRLVAGALGPEDYGSLSLILGLVLLSGGLAVTPWLQAVIRLYPDVLLQGRLGAMRALSLRVVGRNALVGAAVLLGLAAATLSPVHLATGALVAALLLAEGLRAFELALFSAARRQREAALVTSLEAWARPLLALLMLRAPLPGVQAVLGGYLLGTVAVLLLLRAATRLEGTARDAPDRDGRPGDLAAEMSAYAAPLIPLAILGWVSGLGDRYVIGGLLGLEAAGIYAAVSGLISRPFLMLSNSVEQVYRPMLHDALSKGNRAAERQLKRRWLLVAAASSLACALLVALLHGALARWLLPEDFRGAAALMPVIAAGYALHNAATVFTRFCYAYKDTRSVLLLTGAAAALSVVVAVPAVALFGLPGAAAAVPLAFALELAVARWRARAAEAAYARTEP